MYYLLQVNHYTNLQHFPKTFSYSFYLSITGIKIDWSKSAAEIYNLYRGLTPWPGVWTTWNDKRLKLLKIKPNNFSLTSGLVKIEKQEIFIGTGQGSLEVMELQVEGKKQLLAPAFIAGNSSINGVTLQ